ncbi:pentapeptide repeat-containing protein [uncultured Robinsoniella sp.]|uniref:ion channel n=1 Tax=uncultured Robinsoniella sp. TaxID=904190 RepID=UPI00374F1770
MKINYKIENKKYEEAIKKYKANSRTIKDEQSQNLRKRMNHLKLPHETEKEILFGSIKEDNLGDFDTPIIFEDKSYTFVNFSNTKIGTKAVLSEHKMFVHKNDFWGVDFTNCIFQNIKFTNCRFWGCTFNQCYTTQFGVIFDNCIFRNSHMKHIGGGNFETIQQSTEFINCSMTSIKFRNCFLDYTFWKSCTLILSTFLECDMNQSIFSDCGFYSVTLNNSNISGMAILHMKNADIEFYGNYPKSEFYQSVYVDLMDYNLKKQSQNKESVEKSEKENAAQLAKMYYTLLNCLQSKNSNIDYIEEYRYQYHRHRMLAKQTWYLQVWDRISWAMCGFGEKLNRFVIWFSSTIILFAILYMFSGLQLYDKEINYTLFHGTPVPFTEILKDFGSCLHFSIVTFSTVGYGNITPLTNISTFLCSLQILIGILFVAMFTSIIIKKLIRI